MDDAGIIELFFSRDEAALSESERQYGALLYTVAYGLLSCRPDAEECVNDCLNEAWSRIPPERPENLRAWLCRVTRNISIDRWRREHAQKRNAGVPLALSELAECLPDPHGVQAGLEAREIGRAVDAWLRTLPAEDRRLFVRRYFFGEPLKALEAERGEKLAVRMHRLRKALRAYLEKEEIYL